MTVGQRSSIVRMAVARCFRRYRYVSADDLHDELSHEEYPWDRRGFGMVLKHLEQEGRIKRVGYINSHRGNARAILLFQESSPDDTTWRQRT